MLKRTLAAVIILVMLLGTVMTAYPSIFTGTKQAPALPETPTVTTRVGENVTLFLDGNPSAGYSWEPRFNETYLKLLDKQFSPNSTALGAPGKEVFSFRALKEGTTSITFQYKRSWESAVQQTAVCRVVITR